MQLSPPDRVHGPARRILSRLGLALALPVLGLSILAQDAHAAFTSCRSDPVLVVNGSAVDVVSTLNADAGAIRELDYVVTVPVGSLIGQTTLTLGIGFPEKVTYVYSYRQPWGTMSIAATVQTLPGTAPFATTVQATGLLTGGSAQGSSTSTVTVNVGHLLML